MELILKQITDTPGCLKLHVPTPSPSSLIIILGLFVMTATCFCKFISWNFWELFFLVFGKNTSLGLMSILKFEDLWVNFCEVWLKIQIQPLPKILWLLCFRVHRRVNTHTQDDRSNNKNVLIKAHGYNYMQPLYTMPAHRTTPVDSSYTKLHDTITVEWFVQLAQVKTHPQLFSIVSVITCLGWHNQGW